MCSGGSTCRISQFFILHPTLPIANSVQDGSYWEGNRSSGPLQAAAQAGIGTVLPAKCAIRAGPAALPGNSGSRGQTTYVVGHLLVGYRSVLRLRNGIHPGWRRLASPEVGRLSVFLHQRSLPVCWSPVVRK